MKKKITFFVESRDAGNKEDQINRHETGFHLWLSTVGKSPNLSDPQKLYLEVAI